MYPALSGLVLLVGYVVRTSFDVCNHRGGYTDVYGDFLLPFYVYGTCNVYPAADILSLFIPRCLASHTHTGELLSSLSHVFSFKFPCNEL